MTPFVTNILLSLCGAFLFGTLVGWLTKQIWTRGATQRERERWEKQRHQQKEELQAAQLLARKQAEAIQGLQEQLTSANTVRKNVEAHLATTEKELKRKVAELVLSEAKCKESEEAWTRSDAALAEKRQLADRLEEEIKTLCQDLTSKTEASLQLTQQLKDQENVIAKLREQEATFLLNRSRLEFTLRTKDTELQQLQHRFTETEARQTQLLEKNRNLSHSCARYQEDLHASAETIEQLRAEISTLHQRESAAPAPTQPSSLPHLREHLNMRDKDEEISRLRARVAGLQLLLRHGVGQSRAIVSGVPVVMDATRK
jgi:chromosome segregation ATPase